MIGSLYFQFLEEPPYCSPQWLYQFIFPATVQEASLFSTSSPAFIVHRPLDDGHSDWCEVVPHYGFDLHFSSNQRCYVSLRVPSWHLYVFFGEMSIQIFSPFLIELFFFLILSYMSCFIFLKLSPCQSHLLQIFSPILYVDFHFAYGFLCCTKAFKLNQVPFVYFCFYFHYSRN